MIWHSKETSTNTTYPVFSPAPVPTLSLSGEDPALPTEVTLEKSMPFPRSSAHEGHSHLPHGWEGQAGECGKASGGIWDSIWDVLTWGGALAPSCHVPTMEDAQ